MPTKNTRKKNAEIEWQKRRALNAQVEQLAGKAICNCSNLEQQLALVQLLYILSTEESSFALTARQAAFSHAGELFGPAIRNFMEKEASDATN